MTDGNDAMSAATRIPASTYATIQARAKTLGADGYRAEEILADLYRVTGGTDAYYVDLRDQTCDCPAAERWGVCKHRAGLEKLLDDQAREQETDETPVLLWDCDEERSADWDSLLRLVDAQIEWAKIAGVGGRCVWVDMESFREAMAA